ncbi:hypothetical protein ACOMHN_023655 [Nucella lapillus]
MPPAARLVQFGGTPNEQEGSKWTGGGVGLAAVGRLRNTAIKGAELLLIIPLLFSPLLCPFIPRFSPFVGRLSPLPGAEETLSEAGDEKVDLQNYSVQTSVFLSGPQFPEVPFMPFFRFLCG